MFIPLGVDVPMSRRPWANFALMGVIVAVSVAGFSSRSFFNRLAGIPKPTWAQTIEKLTGIKISPDLGPAQHTTSSLDVSQYPAPVLAVTSSFLHAGWLHLIGNLVFLWIFGNAINYKFGQVGYLLLYLGCAMAGGLANYGITDQPVVGASGAVFAVMAAFLVFFPRNDFRFYYLYWGGGYSGYTLRSGVGTIACGWTILLFLLWSGVDMLTDRGHIAIWAHVGGFLAGLAVATLCAAAGVIKPTEDEQTLLQMIGLQR